MVGVQTELEEVEKRIAQQASAFDPAIEGYVTYAIGGRGKRLRPLMALLSGGATGGFGSSVTKGADGGDAFRIVPPKYSSSGYRL